MELSLRGISRCHDVQWCLWWIRILLLAILNLWWGRDWSQLGSSLCWKVWQHIFHQIAYQPSSLSGRLNRLLASLFWLGCPVCLGWLRLVIHFQGYWVYLATFWIDHSQLVRVLLGLPKVQNVLGISWWSFHHFRLRAYQDHSMLRFLHTSPTPLAGPEYWWRNSSCQRYLQWFSRNLQLVQPIELDFRCPISTLRRILVGQFCSRHLS